MTLLFIGVVSFLVACQFWSINATVRIGSIFNASLVAPQGIQMNGTCSECNCAMAESSNITILSLNCYSANRTCELFTNYSSSFIYQMQVDLNRTFYFRQLPPDNLMTSLSTNSLTSESSTKTSVPTSELSTKTSVTTSELLTKTLVITSEPSTKTAMPTSEPSTKTLVMTSELSTKTSVTTSEPSTKTLVTTSELSTKTSVTTSELSTKTLVATSLRQLIFTTAMAITTRTITTAHPVLVTTVASEIITSVIWSFDNNCNDFYNVYNGILQSGASFSSSVGITGYGSALVISSGEYVEIDSPGLPLVNRSFTIEVWVNPGSGMSSNDFLMFTQCSNTTSGYPYMCLSVILRSGKPMLSFYYGGDCMASKSVTMNSWAHLAFVYDVKARCQYIYVNGELYGFNSSVGLYIGSSATPLLIGGSSMLGMYYVGQIDQLSLITRVKNATEILQDATLTAHYTFDSSIFLYDSGPNLINGTGVNINSVNNGRLNQAACFNQSLSYFQASGFVLFGTSNLPYTFAMWIYPYSNTNATLLLAWKNSWCVPLLGFSTSGSLYMRHRTTSSAYVGLNSTSYIPLNAWTHIAHSYSSTLGVRLYVNGTLVSTATTTTFYSASSSMALALGSCVNSTLCSCPSGSIIMGQYYGLIDDFQLYSRQLNDSDVRTLANP